MTFKVPVVLHVVATTDGEAYDAVNETLREQTQKFCGSTSPLIDYSVGDAEKVLSWRDRIIEALDGWSIGGAALENMADNVLDVVGKHLPDPNVAEEEDA
jgi:hypothetical protein